MKESELKLSLIKPKNIKTIRQRLMDVLENTPAELLNKECVAFVLGTSYVDAEAEVSFTSSMFSEDHLSVIGLIESIKYEALKEYYA